VQEAEAASGCPHHLHCHFWRRRVKFWNLSSSAVRRTFNALYVIPLVLTLSVITTVLLKLELTNNITISLGRGMDRRMIKIPFGLDDDMYQTVQDAIRSFKTREFSVSSIDDASISNLVRLSPGRYEDMYVPVSPNGDMGYDIDILPGLDNAKSTELLPQLKNQFLDSINIPASAIDSAAEADFSRSIALRSVYFSKEIVDYQKPFNETITQIIRKIYTDEYKYIGNKPNEESNINLDNFKA